MMPLFDLDAGREVAVQQPAGTREIVAQQERKRCNNQPARERRSARRETVARQERGGVVRQIGCTGSTTKSDAARQQVI
jgi:hypothetical protein